MSDLELELLERLLRRAAKDISDTMGEGGPLTGDQVEDVSRLFVMCLADYNCEMGRVGNILA
jgi:hypothetical protein